MRAAAADGTVAQRWVRLFAATPSGSWVLSRLMPQLDRAALRLTGRRYTLTAIMTGLPVVVLTTTGSRTGKRRTVSVLGFPIADGLAVVAGNFGRPSDPAWCVNLRSNPRATLAQGNTSRAVIAHELAGERRDSAWQQCLSFYPAGASYAERAAPRVIAVFLLDPDSGLEHGGKVSSCGVSGDVRFCRRARGTRDHAAPCAATLARLCRDGWCPC